MYLTIGVYALYFEVFHAEITKINISFGRNSSLESIHYLPVIQISFFTAPSIAVSQRCKKCNFQTFVFGPSWKDIKRLFKKRVYILYLHKKFQYVKKIYTYFPIYERSHKGITHTRKIMSLSVRHHFDFKLAVVFLRYK